MNERNLEERPRYLKHMLLRAGTRGELELQRG